MKTEKNRLLLENLILLILLLIVLLIILLGSAVSRNKALQQSLNLLEAHQEEVQNAHQQEIETLEAVIDHQEEENRELKQKLLVLETKKLDIKTKSREDQKNITRIWTIDSLYREIARHYGQ